MATLVLLSVSLLILLAKAQSECINTTIQLVGENAGVVEYCLNGVWRRLCRGKSVWQAREAIVTCRQLGYEGGRQGGTCDESMTMPFFRLARNCNGTENSIEECGGVMDVDRCPCADNNQHGTLACAQVQCADNEVRLVGGSTNREGRVEVCVDGRWGTVCNNSQEGIAGAVCSQLGFPPTGAEAVPTFVRTGPPIHNCTISEVTLSCALITDGSCDHTMDLGVQCKSYNEVSQCDTSTTTALGVVIVVLVALLAATLIILSFLAIHRRHSAKPKLPKPSPPGLTTKRNESYSHIELDNQVHNDATPPNYSAVGPNYNTEAASHRGTATYNAIDPELNTPQAKPANPTPVRDEASKKEDEFYDAEQHTYSAVSVNRKKKAKTVAENGRGDTEEDEYARLEH